MIKVQEEDFDVGAELSDSWFFSSFDILLCSLLIFHLSQQYFTQQISYIFQSLHH